MPPCFLRSHRASLVALLWLAACERDEAPGANEKQEKRSAAQPLLGGTDFDDGLERTDEGEEPACNDDDKALFRQMMILGRTVAQGHAVRECVQQTMLKGDEIFGPYKPCLYDPFARTTPERRAQGVLDILATPNPVKITCTTGNIGVTRVGGQYGVAEVMREPFEIPNPPLDQLFDATWLASAARLNGTKQRDEVEFQARVNLLAPRVGLIWHEAMHVHAYRHDCGDQTYFESVPYIVQHCVQRVAELSAQHCDMRGGCARGHELALIASYPPEGDDSPACECVRDAEATHDAELPATPVLDHASAGDRMGASLAAGDFNGDGFADLAVGAPGRGAEAGRVYVYLGSIFGLHAVGRLSARDHAADETPGDEFGAALSAGDFDQDGMHELVVGAPGSRGQRGALFVYRGTRAGLVAQAAPERDAWTGEQAGERLGHALAAASTHGEVYLAAGSPGAPTEKTRVRGSVRVWRGTAEADGLLSPLMRLQTPAPGPEPDGFGFALAFGEFSDQDRIALFVGAPFDTRGGAVHVASLPQAARAAALHPESVWVPGSGAPEGFGTSIAVGRLAGAGTLLVGAPAARVEEHQEAGRIYLLRASSHGGPLLQSLAGRHAGARLGSAVFALGRWELLDELVASAPGDPETLLHWAHSSFDASTMDYRAGPSEGPALSTPATAFARADFDGDGALDLAVGAPDDQAAHAGGQVFVFRRTAAGKLVPWGRYRTSD